jgi:serine/threonine protein kinase
MDQTTHRISIDDCCCFNIPNTLIRLYGFKKYDDLIWSIFKQESTEITSSYCIKSGPAEIQLLGSLCRLSASCDCCVYIEDIQINCGSTRKEFIEFLRIKMGALFDGKVVELNLENTMIPGLRVYREYGPDQSAVSYRSNRGQLNDELFVLLKCLGHPNIVEFKGAYFLSTDKFLVTTKLSLYGDLYTQITRRKFSPIEALTLGIQIFDALEFLHETVGYVWRDGKPENVIVLDERCSKIQLADFQFACPIGQVLERSRCGTPGYSAPELFQASSGINRLSEKIDIWSAGSILFDLLFQYPLCPSIEDNANFHVEYLQNTLIVCGVNKRQRFIDVPKITGLSGFLHDLLTEHPENRLNAKLAKQGCLFYCNSINR